MQRQMKWVAAFLVGIVCCQPVADARLFGRGGASTANPTVEIGSGITLTNIGSSGTNVPVRFGFAFARGDMLSGNTLTVQDDLGNTLTAQIDQISTRTGMPGATDTDGWIHAVISVIEPTWATSTNRTFHVYKQSGSYTPGTGLATSALTGAHQYQILFNNVKDGGGNTIGSGNFTCDLNTAIAAGARTQNGGYTKTYDGAVQTTIEAIQPCIDNADSTADGQLLGEFYAVLWQTTAGSGTLGNIELATYLTQPWQNVNSFAGTGSIAGTTLTLTSKSAGRIRVGAQIGTTGITAIAQGTVVTSVGTCGGASPTLPCTATVNNSQTVASEALVGNPRFVHGDASVYDVTTATTLRSYSSTTNFAPSGVNTAAGGTIGNTDGIQWGEALTFAVSGGGTLPTGITAGQLYFAKGTVTGTTPDDYALSKNAFPSSGYTPSDAVTISSQGSCPSGSCFAVTRRVSMDQFAGAALFADDVGSPFWIGSNGTSIYPTLTTAQRTYLEATGIVPGFTLNGEVPPTAFSPCPGGFACNAGGVTYRPHALGPQEANISGGGNHTMIGVWSMLAASWFITQTTANWDTLRAHALTQINAYVHHVLNETTGYIAAYDNGPYPGGGSYTTIGAGRPDDYNIGQYNSLFSVGFSIPNVPSGILTPNYWGIGTLGDTMNQTSNTASSHEPDWGNADVYLITGEPWQLRAAQHQGNFSVLAMWPPSGNSAGQPYLSRSTDLDGITYYAKVFFSDNEMPRGSAWAFRNIAKAAVLGADNDPQKAVMWSYFKENVDAFYAFSHLYWGAVDPNFETLGLTETYTNGGDNFMWPYTLGAVAMAHATTHYVSPTLSGASTLYLLNQASKLPAYFWTTLATVADAAGHTVCNYWAPVEESTQMLIATQDPSGYTSPGAPNYSANMGGVGIDDAWAVGTRGTVVNVDGSITPNTDGPSTVSTLSTNGDAVWIIGDDGFSLFGSTLYYMVNVIHGPPNSNARFSVTTTSPLVQACSGATGSSGCPAAFVPGNGLPGTARWSWRPQACPAAPDSLDGSNHDVAGYTALVLFGLHMAINAGGTVSELAGAVTNALTRWNPSSPYSNGAVWPQWYVGAATIP